MNTQISIRSAAALMNKSEQFLQEGLKQKSFPPNFGCAVKLRQWSYYISRKGFEDFTGIKINDETETNLE